MPDLIPFNPALLSPPSDSLKRTLYTVRGAASGFVTQQATVSPLVSHPYNLHLESRAEVADLKAWFDGLKGRCKPFWVPSYQMDLEPAEMLSAGFTTLTIKRIDYTNLLFPLASRRQIGFIRFNGTVEQREVTASVDNGDGTETLTLETAVDATYLVDFELLSFVRLMRLVNDRLDLTWNSSEDIDVPLSFVELPREVGVPDFEQPCLIVEDFDYPTMGALLMNWTPLHIPSRDPDGIQWLLTDTSVHLAIWGPVTGKHGGVNQWDDDLLYRDFSNLVVGETYRVRAWATRSGYHVNSGVIFQGDNGTTLFFTTDDAEEMFEAMIQPDASGTIRVSIGAWYTPTANDSSGARDFYFNKVEIAGPGCQT